MNIPKYARYEYCAKRACEFLEEYNISSFPVDVEKIIHDQKWALTPYSQIMEEFQCDRETVIRCLRSRDGYTQLDKDNYSIAYNDDSLLGNRKRFTLMHEVGHIYLHHLTDFDITLISRGSLTKDENRVLENEANTFARNVLVPTSMLQQLENKSIQNISYHFGITPRAARTRVDLYPKDVTENLRLNLSDRLRNVFYQFYYKKHCPICNYYTVSKNMNFCPICGSNSIKWGEGVKMQYRNHEIDENGRLKKCIKCDNEELVGGYCHICGSPVENYCVEATTYYDSPECCDNIQPLSPNARFCPLCGSESTFNQRGILIDWSQERRQIEEAEAKHATESQFMNIPDDIDEELPFDATSSQSNKSNTVSNNDLIGVTDLFGDIDEELPFN